MPDVQKNCSIFNAFNFKHDVHESLGHITSLKIGEEADLVANFTLKEPVESGDESVVGAISSLSWGGGYAQPIQITFNVSIENKNELATLLHTEMKSLKVVFGFNIYEYDEEAGAFYKSLHCNDTELNAVMEISGTERQLWISDEPDGEVQQPRNFQVTLGIVPEDQQQEIHMAVSQDKKFVLPWGVTRG